MLDGVEVLGGIAAVLTTIEAIPQVIKSIRTRSTRDISLGSIMVVISGLLCWTAYGVIKKDLWIVLSTGIATLFYITLLVVKLAFEK